MLSAVGDKPVATHFAPSKLASEDCPWVTYSPKPWTGAAGAGTSIPPTWHTLHIRIIPEALALYSMSWTPHNRVLHGFRLFGRMREEDQ